METLCCSSQCERYFDCGFADVNYAGTCVVENFYDYGSGTFLEDGTCKIDHWCGELGNWKMFKPIKEQEIGCACCSTDYNQEITAYLTRYHSGGNVSTKEIRVCFCPECGKRLNKKNI